MKRSHQQEEEQQDEERHEISSWSKNLCQVLVIGTGIFDNSRSTFDTEKFIKLESFSQTTTLIMWLGYLAISRLVERTVDSIQCIHTNQQLLSLTAGAWWSGLNLRKHNNYKLQIIPQYLCRYSQFYHDVARTIGTVICHAFPLNELERSNTF